MTTTPETRTAGPSAPAHRDEPAGPRLVRPPAAAGPITPSPEQQEVIAHRNGRLRVLAGPGTGKTATIVEAVADRIERRGIDPASILVLTFSRRAAAELGSRIASRVTMTVTEPVVRTLHSYAYAIVRSSALAAGDPPPRLLDAGQADLMVRDMLAGHADDGAPQWPPFLHAALRVPAFAAELREFLLRTAGRQIGPARIAALGERLGHPEWVAAAAFIREYRNIADLRQASTRRGAALDQAELTTAALERLADPDVLAAQQSRIRHIIVDEYQDVDPAQARLIEILASGADELLVVGDPDQSIYTFRGAQPGALDRVEVDRTVALTTCHRMAGPILAATRRLAALIPGPPQHRDLAPADLGAPGLLTVRILTSAAQEASYIADQLRRAHIEHGVAWSRMAIVVRSPQATGGALRRACAAVGIPVAASATGPLASDPLVAALLTVLRAGVEPRTLTGRATLTLLGSPLGQMDPLMVRRLRRAVKAGHAAASDPADGAPSGAGAEAQSGDLSGAPPEVPPGESTGGAGGTSSIDLLAGIVAGARPMPSGLPAELAAPLRRLVDLVAIATRESHSSPAEATLWAIWQRAGIVQGLLAACERGGREAVTAHALLDSAVALFARAAEFADQLPGAGIGPFVELLSGEQLPDPMPTGARTDGVTIVSAHSAKGLEWDVVAVAAVQHDHWPDLRPRASLLALQELLDAADGMDRPLPRLSRLADERRLFYVAVTRARRRLIVTAVDDDDSTPSRFLTDLVDESAIGHGWPQDARGRPRRSLHVPALVADLRRAVVDGGADGDERARRAARALATLAADQVRGAHPSTWYGLAEPSTTTPPVPDGDTVILSPSQVDALVACPLKAVLERQGARGESTQAQLLGIAIHAIAEGIAAGATAADLDAAVDEFVDAQDHLAGWERARLRRAVGTMRTALHQWIDHTNATRRFVASERSLAVRLPPGTEQGPSSGRPVEIRGRVDWLSQDSDGRLVITDFKTGATVPSAAAAAEHAQLATYQIAVALGAISDDGGSPEPPGPDDAARRDVAAEVGGAELVYLRKGRPAVRVQAPHTAEQRERWLDRLREAAEAASGAVLTARVGDQCDHCPVRASCPLQPEGRQVTQ